MILNDIEIAAIEKEITKLQNLKTAMMQKLFLILPTVSAESDKTVTRYSVLNGDKNGL